MAKTIKFNLICNQKPIRTIEDLQNNFSIEDVLTYYRNGLLTRWLEVRGYTEELEAVKAISETDNLKIIKELIKIFDITKDDNEIQQGIYILNYLNENKELLDCYRQENFKKQSIIDDYAQGYKQLVNGILQNPSNAPYIKANIREIVNNYSWVLELDHRNLFNTLMENDCILAIMCLMMFEECRKYYLPIEDVDENGNLIFDISSNEDKKIMYTALRKIVYSSEKLRMLGDNVCRYSGVTADYWADLADKGKKYMIIRIGDGDFVRSAGNRDEQFSYDDVKDATFPLVDGVDYKSKNSNNTLFYMEV